MIDRISKNEERLDNTISCINELKTSLEKFKSNKNNLSLLKKYYSSKNWFKDKEMYENNFLSIKAGVLSEDAVWNMLDDLDELINDMKEVITDFEGDN